MDSKYLSYIRSLVPEDLKKGAELIEEGKKLGEGINPVRPKYYTSRGFDNPNEALQQWVKDGDTGHYCVNIGMATTQETVDACLELARWGDEIGIKVMAGLLLPSMQVGVPEEKRDSELDTTAFMPNGLEDYKCFNREEIWMPYGNFVMFCPNTFETVKFGLESGLVMWGSTSQLSWDYPGCDDHKTDVENLVRSIGILKRHEDFYPSVGCYVEDGLAGGCVDTVSLVAYYLFERYIYSDLCGLPCNPCFGALVSDIKTKIAVMVALNDFAKERGGSISFVHASTTLQWDHDIAANYGASAQEMLAIFLAEDHYKTGTNVLAVPATEAITVPTLQEIKDIIAATGRTKEFVPQWRDIMDWTAVDERIHTIKEQAQKMFNNMLTIMSEAGIDVKDPAQLLMFIKDVDASLFEQMFHPSVVETGVFKPWYTNDMGAWTVELVEYEIGKIEEAGLEAGCLKGKTIINGSTDVHIYGSTFVNAVLTYMGAEVIDIGVDNSPQHMVDMATEIGADIICASTHSGNALGMGKYFEDYLNEQGKDYKVMMGGILTSILEGHSEPSDVTDMLNEFDHILATNEMIDQIKSIIE